jgi:hypothetical protein
MSAKRLCLPHGKGFFSVADSLAANSQPLLIAGAVVSVAYSQRDVHLRKLNPCAVDEQEFGESCDFHGVVVNSNAMRFFHFFILRKRIFANRTSERMTCGFALRIIHHRPPVSSIVDKSKLNQNGARKI